MKDSDKLIAIFGLASEVDKPLVNDEYVAGLWRSDLLLSLL
jgi:hypothetical protein